MGEGPNANILSSLESLRGVIDCPIESSIKNLNEYSIGPEGLTFLNTISISEYVRAILMPYKYIIDSEANLVTVLLRPECHFGNCVEAIVELKDNPDFRSDMKIFVNAIEMEMKPSIFEITSLANIFMLLRNQYNEVRVLPAPHLAKAVQIYSSLISMTDTNVKFSMSEDDINAGRSS